jgi:manganese/zinc/iron transport system permease protein
MYFNPYTDQDFFGFFGVLFSRLFLFITGRLPTGSLVSDEIQIVVLSCVAVTGAMVGTFLILRRMVMLANALSHTILLGIVIAFLLCETLTLPILMAASLITGIATTFLTEYLNRVIKLQEDASIGLIFSIFFALGVLLLTLFGRNVHIGTELVMGNVDALQRGDIKIVASVLGINVLLFLLLYYGFKITTFDPNLARAFGFSPLFFNYLLMVQTSSAAVGAFRAVGVLMVMAFFVLPPLTARLLTNRLPTLIVLSALIGTAGAVLGVAVSRNILTLWDVGLSTAGIVVIVLACFYLCAIVIRSIDFSLRARYHPISKQYLEKDEKNCPIG